jgi:uncharacterized membrane protein
MSFWVLADLAWGAPQWFLPAAALALLAMTLIGRSYIQSRGGREQTGLAPSRLVRLRLRSSTAVRWIAALLKTAGLLLLIACLLEPLWIGTRPQPGANQFAVVVDNSQSLQLIDAGSALSRGQWLKDNYLSDAADWQVRLAQDFDIRRYLIDGRLSRVPSFEGIEFDGGTSMLGGGLQTFGERFRGRPLAGILLLTDGNATDADDLADPPRWLSGLPPVYPVVVGTDRPSRDISLSRVAVNQTNFEASPVTVHAEVATSGYPRQTVIAELLDAAGKVVAKQIAPTTDERQPLTFRFAFRPEQPGLDFYRVRVAAEADLQTAARDLEPEATMANNTRLLMVDRGGGPYRVLYVGGRPNWEYKFLRRAVDDDAEVQLAALVRIAKREPKFTFLGRRGENTNPLFRGFDAAAEEAQSYDQPVLLRLGVQNADELRDGFPRTEEELFPYHAVILDDLEAEFFTHDQMLLLQRFASHRGGGVMMLGGVESFVNGQYQRTPVGDMLPVYLDRHTVRTGGRRSSFPPGTDPRRLAAVVGPVAGNGIGRTAAAERDAALKTVNRVGRAKPGAVVLAHAVRSDGSEMPALVVQRFGNGRTAALTIGDLWRWTLRRPEGSEADGSTAWRQTLRWLVSDVPGRIQADVQRRPREPGNPVRLKIAVKDEKYNPLDNATVQVKVAVPDGTEIELAADPVSEASGEVPNRLRAASARRLPGHESR